MEKLTKHQLRPPECFRLGIVVGARQLIKRGKKYRTTYLLLSYLHRQPETIHIEPCEVIIIEGILALCDPTLRALMDLKIFVDADPDERLIRVIQRDMLERGRTAEAVMERYVSVLKPMHLEFIEPTKRYADLIIPQGGHNKKAVEIMKTYIENMLHFNK